MTARQWLVAHQNTIFRSQTQRDDLLSEEKTQGCLIGLLVDCIRSGCILEFTAICSDHHNDSDLGVHTHNPNGYCADVWPLRSPAQGDYAAPLSDEMTTLLTSARDSMWIFQIGLAGTAYTARNMALGGNTTFHDDGADHIHLGAKA